MHTQNLARAGRVFTTIEGGIIQAQKQTARMQSTVENMHTQVRASPPYKCPLSPPPLSTLTRTHTHAHTYARPYQMQAIDARLQRAAQARDLLVAPPS